MRQKLTLIKVAKALTLKRGEGERGGGGVQRCEAASRKKSRGKSTTVNLHQRSIIGYSGATSLCLSLALYRYLRVPPGTGTCMFFPRSSLYFSFSLFFFSWCLFLPVFLVRFLVRGIGAFTLFIFLMVVSFANFFFFLFSVVLRLFLPHVPPRKRRCPNARHTRVRLEAREAIPRHRTCQPIPGPSSRTQKRAPLPLTPFSLPTPLLLAPPSPPVPLSLSLSFPSLSPSLSLSSSLLFLLSS